MIYDYVMINSCHPNRNGDVNQSKSNQEMPGTPCDTTELQQNFEVFLQTLISQVLDSNFISEIVKENGEWCITHDDLLM